MVRAPLSDRYLSPVARPGAQGQKLWGVGRHCFFVFLITVFCPSGPWKTPHHPTRPKWDAGKPTAVPAQEGKMGSLLGKEDG